MSPARETFPKRLRLLKPSEFQQVFQTSCRVGDRCLVLLARPNGLDHARLGLTVGRRAVRRAVDRSYVKRRIRESFRRHQHLLTGIDIVALAGRGCADKIDGMLSAQLERYWPELVRRCKG